MKRGINHTSLYWLATTTPDSHAAAMQFVSGALGSLLSATRWGRTWVMRGAPPYPGRTIAGCIASDLIWNLLSCTTKSPIHSALTSRKWMRGWMVGQLCRVWSMWLQEAWLFHAWRWPGCITGWYGGSRQAVGHPPPLNGARRVRLLTRTDRSWSWLQQLHRYTSSL